MAVEADTDALAERVYASMVGDEAWRRLPEELKAQRRAEGMAFQRDVVLGLSPPFRWEDLKVPSLFGVGLQSWPFSQDAATRLAESLGAELFTIADAGSQRACDPSPAICGVRATQHSSADRRGRGRPGRTSRVRPQSLTRPAAQPEPPTDCERPAPEPSEHATERDGRHLRGPAT